MSTSLEGAETPPPRRDQTESYRQLLDDARLAHLDQLQRELVDLRSYRRRMLGVWEIVSCLAQDLDDRVIQFGGFNLDSQDNCDNCRRILDFLESTRNMIEPPDRFLISEN